MSLNRLLALAATLEPPFVLLEDGRAAGAAHLAWGARRRLRRDGEGWGDSGRARLESPPGEGRWYGTIAYELGLPGALRPARTVVPQPLYDLFEPANLIVLPAGGEVPTFHGTEARARWDSTPGASLPPVRVAVAPLRTGTPWRSFDAESFTAAVAKAREYIAAGDIYQVNISVAERWPAADRPWEAYLRLRSLNPSPWMGYADFGDWQLVCGSPELLVELGRGNGKPAAEHGWLRTRPIAGTRKKTGDEDRDARMHAELRLDAKERAEHVMLLDLARNDTGRVAQYGSVVVAEREVVEEYSHVFHLVSEVRGTLRPGLTTADVIASYFPGGTITGCPKIRAMEIIHELEPVARGAYTGALGWIEPDALQLNIVIRSAVVAGGEVAIQAGAGIVADSIPEREWRESLRKAAAVREAFGFS